MGREILVPAAVLVLWSLVMLGWVVVTRLPAMAKKGVTLGSAQPGGRGQDLERVLPPEVNWKAHNFTHLMEQPTLFYAAVAILAIAGSGGGINLVLAWAYTGLRIAHSLWQALVNTLPVRFALFAMSTLCLALLAVNALRAALAL